MTYIIRLDGDLPHNFVIGTCGETTVFCAQNRYTPPNELGGSSQNRHSDLARLHSLESVIGAGTCHIPVDKPTTLYINGRGSDGDIIRYPRLPQNGINPVLDELLKSYQALFPKIQRVEIG